MTRKHNLVWLMAAMGGICLGAAGVGLSQPGSAAPVLTPPPAHSPDDLSTAFREIAQRVLPSVVSIATETKPQSVTMDDDEQGTQFQFQVPEGPEGDMFRRFFGDNPDMEQFFNRRMPHGNMQRFIPRQRGAGSGFIVDSSGIILTNSHVVDGADRVTVKLHDGREIEAESWNADPRSDVAIVRIKTGEDLPALTLGDSDQMQVGDWVLALGNPFNVGTTMTAGIISATGRGPGINEREEYLQTDAAINPGNSGGPLVNLYGDVVGINTAISSRSGGYEGVGFAIPSKNARWVTEQLIAKGEVNRSYLGVALKEMTGEMRKVLNAPRGQGALISDVRPGGPAEKAKLQPADVILEFAGRTIRDRDDLMDAIERSAPGRAYDMTLLRDGKQVHVSVSSSRCRPITRRRCNDFTPRSRRRPDRRPRVKSCLGSAWRSPNSTPNWLKNWGLRPTPKELWCAMSVPELRPAKLGCGAAT